MKGGDPYGIYTRAVLSRQRHFGKACMLSRKTREKTLEALLEATGRTMAEIRPGEVCAELRVDNKGID